jgi:hypothetical protein
MKLKDLEARVARALCNNKCAEGTCGACMDAANRALRTVAEAAGLEDARTANYALDQDIDAYAPELYEVVKALAEAARLAKKGQGT